MIVLDPAGISPELDELAHIPETAAMFYPASYNHVVILVKPVDAGMVRDLFIYGDGVGPCSYLVFSASIFLKIFNFFVRIIAPVFLPKDCFVMPLFFLGHYECKNMIY